MSIEWLKPRKYRHFDSPVNEIWAKKAMDKAFVSRHNFVPLIHYTKVEKRYKKSTITGLRTITKKCRPIKFASHRDATIMSYYAYQLNHALENYYKTAAIGDSVIAYRALGRANYDFSAEALAFAQANTPVIIFAFDVTGFFDNLDHALLKRRLKAVLGVKELPADWHNVFRAITRFHFVDLAELEAHPIFGLRLKNKSRDRIAAVEELKAANIKFQPNPELANGYKRGIPQGTPISAAVSNLYMIEFDVAARAVCDKENAFYRRYSDDILIICPPKAASAIEAEVMKLIVNERLEIAQHKTEKTLYDKLAILPSSMKAAQYLGFTLAESGPAIRESSLSRQWRKMRRAIKRARISAQWRSQVGKPGEIYCKRLYRRFSYINVHDGASSRALRNFSSYGRRSAAALGLGEKVSKQVNRFERAALREIAKLKANGKPLPIHNTPSAAQPPRPPNSSPADSLTAQTSASATSSKP